MNSNLYDDFSTTTEHFYDELGKLSECESFFSKKEYKRLKNKIITLLFDSLDTLFKKENITNKVERNELKKEHNAYKEENNTGFSRKAKNLLLTLKNAVKRTKKDIGTTEIRVIEASKPIGQLPSSQQEKEEEAKPNDEMNAENEKEQEIEENSQEEQNGDA